MPTKNQVLAVMHVMNDQRTRRNIQAPDPLELASEIVRAVEHASEAGKPAVAYTDQDLQRVAAILEKHFPPAALEQATQQGFLPMVPFFFEIAREIAEGLFFRR